MTKLWLLVGFAVMVGVGQDAGAADSASWWWNEAEDEHEEAQERTAESWERVGELIEPFVERRLEAKERAEEAREPGFWSLASDASVMVEAGSMVSAK